MIKKNVDSMVANEGSSSFVPSVPHKACLRDNIVGGVGIEFCIDIEI